MQYWKEFMNWPLDHDWVCETCNHYQGMTWGLIHAECRCDKCHTVYTMRDYKKEGDPIVDIPISKLKEEYKAPAKWLWENLSLGIDEATDDEWDQAIEACNV